MPTKKGGAAVSLNVDRRKQEFAPIKRGDVRNDAREDLTHERHHLLKTIHDALRHGNRWATEQNARARLKEVERLLEALPAAPSSTNYFEVNATLVGNAARTKTLMGKEYRVVPAVLLRSQVLNNNLGRTFVPAQYFTDVWAEMWNGVPVVTKNHPQARGQSISARQPGILEQYGAGQVFNAAVRNVTGNPELTAQVWLDVDRADDVPELKEILKRLNNGETVELSTGFPVRVTAQTGVHNGEQYDAVLEPFGADHLAIFADKTGACSVSDGCGLGVNQSEPTHMPFKPYFAAK
jgi:hypothetical protein